MSTQDRNIYAISFPQGDILEGQPAEGFADIDEFIIWLYEDSPFNVDDVTTKHYGDLKDWQKMQVAELDA